MILFPLFQLTTFVDSYDTLDEWSQNCISIHTHCLGCFHIFLSLRVQVTLGNRRFYPYLCSLDVKTRNRLREIYIIVS